VYVVSCVFLRAAARRRLAAVMARDASRMHSVVGSGVAFVATGSKTADIENEAAAAAPRKGAEDSCASAA
jgi:2-keto-3-deoxy-L-rhamnonate aldolase RhmA